ncbi:hypothetical protein LC724_07205 [Blautia sp. RD014234]|nr:hypothetical protein [Blautia parvula]
MEEGSGSRASYSPFSCAVCAQAISAGNGRDMLHTDAHGLAVGTAAGEKALRSNRQEDRNMDRSP